MVPSKSTGANIHLSPFLPPFLFPPFLPASPLRNPISPSRSPSESPSFAFRSSSFWVSAPLPPHPHHIYQCLHLTHFGRPTLFGWPTFLLLFPETDSLGTDRLHPSVHHSPPLFLAICSNTSRFRITFLVIFTSCNIFYILVGGGDISRPPWVECVLVLLIDPFPQVSVLLSSSWVSPLPLVSHRFFSFALWCIFFFAKFNFHMKGWTDWIYYLLLHHYQTLYYYPTSSRPLLLVLFAFQGLYDSAHSNIYFLFLTLWKVKRIRGGRHITLVWE